ncbi:MAG: HDIG domain-containing metalloprotein [Planctomycetota bacterium]|jgi:putative nucleotidyltransferase with HDIG domain
MITRDEAFELFKSQNPEEHLISHCLETEAVMRGLAEKLGKDVELWGVTGLLHDLDFPNTANTPEKHGLESMGLLEGKLPEEALHAIRAHNGEMTGTAPETDFDWALRCGESVTGLVAANALVRPGKMDGMKPKSLKKKMKEKSFAAKVNRDTIRECEKLGLEPGEFFQIAIDSITPIAGDVGLV